MPPSTELSPLEAHLGYWLRNVSNHVSHAFARKLEAEGVTVAEWVVLRELHRLGETAPSSLAESLGMTRGAISKLVERLVSKELVARRVDDADRRAQRVTLTPAARALLPRLAQRADENDAEFFGHLEEEQRQWVMELLQDVVARHHLRSVPIE